MASRSAPRRNRNVLVEDPFKKHLSVRLVDQFLQHLGSAVRTRARKGVTHVLKNRHVLDALSLQSHRHSSLSDHCTFTAPTSDVAMKRIIPVKKLVPKVARQSCAKKKLSTTCKACVSVSTPSPHSSDFPCPMSLL